MWNLLNKNGLYPIPFLLLLVFISYYAFKNLKLDPPALDTSYQDKIESNIKKVEIYDSTRRANFEKTKKKIFSASGGRPQRDSSLTQYKIPNESILECAVKEDRYLFLYEIERDTNGREFRSLVGQLWAKDFDIKDYPKSIEIFITTSPNEKFSYNPKNKKLRIIRSKSTSLRYNRGEVFVLVKIMLSYTNAKYTSHSTSRWERQKDGVR